MKYSLIKGENSMLNPCKKNSASITTCGVDEAALKHWVEVETKEN